MFLLLYIFTLEYIFIFVSRYLGVAKRKRIHKKIFKLAEGQCRICGLQDYATLDVHRIIEGKNGGKYSEDNSVCVCAVCHRKIHAGTIVVDRYYLGSDGRKLLRIYIDGHELFV